MSLDSLEHQDAFEGPALLILVQDCAEAESIIESNALQPGMTRQDRVCSYLESRVYKLGTIDYSSPLYTGKRDVS